MDDTVYDVGAVVRVTLGIVAGGVVGALVGSAFRTDNWVIVPTLDAAHGGRITNATGV